MILRLSLMVLASLPSLALIFRPGAAPAVRLLVTACTGLLLTLATVLVFVGLLMCARPRC